MFKTTSTKFLAELGRRRREFAYPKLSYRITVPKEHIWWYWNEFGTATMAEKGTQNPAGYKIPDMSKPGSEATGAVLLFPDEHNPGKWVARLEVWHPGIRPHHMITSIIGDLRVIIEDQVANSIVNGHFNLDYLRDTLLKQTLPDIKQAIVESFEVNLNPGGDVRTDPYARLGPGVTAAEAFAEHADIKETT